MHIGRFYIGLAPKPVMERCQICGSITIVGVMYLLEWGPVCSECREAILSTSPTKVGEARFVGTPHPHWEAP